MSVRNAARRLGFLALGLFVSMLQIAASAGTTVEAPAIPFGLPSDLTPRSECVGNALVTRAEGASAANNTAHATELYQQAVDELTSCIKDPQSTGPSLTTLWINRAVAHAALSSIFLDAGRTQDARSQYLGVVEDAAWPCGALQDRNMTSTQKTDFGILLGKLVDLSKSFPNLSDFSAFKACSSPGVIPESGSQKAS